MAPLTDSELEYLSAWSREEWEAACYKLPAHRLQLVAILFRVRGGGVRVESLLTLPGFDDGEMIRAHRMLQHIEPDIPVFPSTRLRQPFEQGGRLRRSHGVDMSDHGDRLTV